MSNATAPDSRSDPAARLVAAAGPLFYREGVATGVDALCRAAGVSKRTMYQLFASKDEVIAAGLDQWADWIRATMWPPDDDGAGPRDRVLAVFAALEAASGDPEFRGCPFVAAAVEVKDPDHPAAVVARRHKEALTGFFATEARRGGAADPDGLAAALTIVYDGSSARAVVLARPLDGLAVATATTLLDAAGLR
ncbi:TetR/AcrR family transcriptional regulator [Frankia sp. AgB1.9]|uniref:TetR/AcrR family transcriptional regulator n=1 Tax=unclassified Frankia TaxID=2632575 RepID=UPI0019347852|nr:MULTISPECIES: TetR/AcrR family transcriptional regulator [unclassified Frankia]MBL7492913.1 TetR/AcrR family transcriptional regulator [Frankia sp. AgW1.1]MBL7550559.1 TetR/AcrR family transcriptional regulator [Frankia sp. AgB1.9]MBL7624925.1 TetR/AcrR family transcriptional regulator [Frankia sp. AgB1.8]